MDKLRCLGASFLAGLALAALIAGAWYWRGITHDDPSVPAKVAPELRDAPTAKVKTDVQVFPGAKVKLSLADGLKNDPAKHVIGATKLDIDDRPRTVTAVIDEATGKTDLYVRADPLPWLAREQRGSIQLAYGYREYGDEPGFRLNAQYDLLQIKALHLGVIGSFDDNGSWFAGVGVAYRWQ